MTFDDSYCYCCCYCKINQSINQLMTIPYGSKALRIAAKTLISLQTMSMLHLSKRTISHELMYASVSLEISSLSSDTELPSLRTSNGSSSSTDGCTGATEDAGLVIHATSDNNTTGIELDLRRVRTIYRPVEKDPSLNELIL